MGIPQWPEDSYYKRSVMRKALAYKNITMLWIQNPPKGYLFMEFFIASIRTILVGFVA